MLFFISHNNAIYFIYDLFEMTFSESLEINKDVITEITKK